MKSRKSVKGLVGLALIATGVVLVANSVIDIAEKP